MIQDKHMMKFLRNNEIIKALILQIALSAIAAAFAYVWNLRFFFFTLGLSAIFLSIHTFVTYKRYRRIYDLSADIDSILHGDDIKISLEKLGILQNEIYKMTNRLREQKQQLQYDKIYLADLIADISHQIRTPLTSANLIVSSFSKPDIPYERRIELSRELLGLLTKIDWLVTSLLKMSGLDAGTVHLKKETIPAEQLVNEFTAPLMIPLELREQNLSVKAEGNFTGDIAWTAEAMGNILKNCMEHTPKGGTIDINASENALYTEIVISDSGSGIDKTDLPHIFERFYKGKNSDDKSFGIGLSLAGTIIRAQNGTVRAKNREPNGAVFTVRFYKTTV